MIETELASAVPEGVIVPPAQIEGRYLGDWIHRAEDAHPVALALPRTTVDVKTILRLCHARSVPVVPQGGGTARAGGAVPSTGCVILSTERMRSIEPADRASATIVAEAGAVLEA